MKKMMQCFRSAVLMGSLCLMPPAAGVADLPVMDDAAFLHDFRVALSQLAEDAPNGKQIGESLGKAPKRLAWSEGNLPPAGTTYERITDSVFALAYGFDCGKCDQWHLGGVATAWCIREDGLLVTNHHVLDEEKAEAWAVCTREGEVLPLEEVLAANPEDDIAIFRVATRGLTALPLGDDAAVGSPVRVVSHPDKKLYVLTSGIVSRYYKGHRHGGPSPLRMAITADYAKGSSGGPVLNPEGAVVGMVLSTRSIYYDHNPDGEPTNLQMVIKATVPVASIRAILDPDPAGQGAPESASVPR